jgi:hypothetical protein
VFPEPKRRLHVAVYRHRGPNLAKLTLARKIAATVRAMSKKEERYTPENVRASLDADRET